MAMSGYSGICCVCKKWFMNCKCAEPAEIPDVFAVYGPLFEARVNEFTSSPVDSHQGDIDPPMGNETDAAW